jgi:ABC-type uncharacterized transport system substrate-binding protein
MSTSSSIKPAGMLLFVMAVLTAVAGTVRADGSSAEGISIIAVEWVPMRCHATIISSLKDEFEETKTMAGEHRSIRRVNAFGDDARLRELLQELSSSPPDMVIGFGDHACHAIRKVLPNSPLVALLVREASVGEAVPNAGDRPLVSFTAAPRPETVWAVARCLKPNMSRMGVLYTKDYAPNEELAEALEKCGRREGRELLRATVPSGFCRVESDFESAVAGLQASKPCDLVYVPDDPNSGRFTGAIYRSTEDLRLPAIGDETSRGKGCVVAIALDYEALGRKAARHSLAFLEGNASETRSLCAPRTLLVDREAMAKYALTASDEELEKAMHSGE